MATQIDKRLALGSTGTGAPDGAWWPRSRRLGDELADLFARWPPEAGRISRVLYSPPDWDDHPRSVAIPGRKVKTGSFPRDDTHQLILTMRQGRRLSITVIPPATPAAEVATLLAGISDPDGASADGPLPVWDNEGGHA